LALSSEVMVEGMDGRQCGDGIRCCGVLLENAREEGHWVPDGLALFGMKDRSAQCSSDCPEIGTNPQSQEISKYCEFDRDFI
jgi:hypothetical protein